MGLETASYIRDLVPANPLGTDSLGQGDEHLRMIKQVLQSTFPRIVGNNLPQSTGSANAQVVVYDFAPTLYLPAESIIFIAGFTNTGATTIAVNNESPVPIHFGAGDIAPNTIQAGYIYELLFDGTYFQIMGSNVGGSGGIGGSGNVARDLLIPSQAATLLASDQFVFVYNTGPAFALTPPLSPTINQSIWIKDAQGSAGGAAISLAGTVDGVLNPTLIDVAYGDIELVFRSSKIFRKTT